MGWRGWGEGILVFEDKYYFVKDLFMRYMYEEVIYSRWYVEGLGEIGV